jgi:hypothetical protein
MEKMTMAYRGEDLDLRTPQTWSSSPDTTGASDPYVNGSRSRQPYARGAQPILVDDTVLACSNHAFDVAVAHRAGEVRLEHLLHAMTRIDGASNALEGRGIRVAGLRRESATIIASEIPIGLSAGQGRPRRSDDFEGVLRVASGIANRRNGPANIDDVIDALLDMPSDVPGIALLARHGGRVARDRVRPRDRDVARERDREPLPLLQPLPPLTRAANAYGSDVRAEPVPKSASYYQADLSRPLRSDLVGTQTDGIQNARIDQLESAVRTLTGELANERNAISSVVQDLQRTMKLERDDTSRFRGGLHDRLQSLEQTVLSSAGDGNSDQLHDRIKSLEYTILNSRKDDGGDATMLLDRLAAVERGLEQRLSELSRPWGVLSDRLKAIEQTILDTRSNGPDMGPIVDRMASLERGMTDRIKMVERAVENAAAKGVDLSPIANRLDIIEEAVLSPDAASQDKVGERLRGIEEAVVSHRTGLGQAAQAINADVKALASALAAQAANTERTHSFVSERVQMLAAGLERQRGELTGSLVERINAQGSDSQRLIAGLNQQIHALEAKLADSVEKTAVAQAAHAAELREVHEALIKLNTNQHTLAGSIDQWRLDGVGDISVIAKQLETLQTASAKPVAMMEQLASSLDNANRVTIERYHRRNRFWYWLFGTDDWLTASWPSQVANIEAERAAMRGSVSTAAPSKGVPGRAA